jgi:hypothetical protein
MVGDGMGGKERQITKEKSDSNLERFQGVVVLPFENTVDNLRY